MTFGLIRFSHSLCRNGRRVPKESGRLAPNGQENGAGRPGSWQVLAPRFVQSDCENRIRTRAIVLAFVLWPLLGLSVVWLSLVVSEWLAILLLPMVFMFQKSFASIRCQHCGKPLGWNKLAIPQKLFGAHFFWWTPFIPKRCPACGNEYERRADELVR